MLGRTHQAPQGSFLSCNDCGGSWCVVHQSQLTKAALVVILSDTHIHIILQHKNLIHTPGNEETVEVTVILTHHQVYICKLTHSLLYDVEIVSIVSLVNYVLLRLDQHFEHGVQNLRELLLEDTRQVFSV